jgi:hypothetical protein
MFNLSNSKAAFMIQSPMRPVTDENDNPNQQIENAFDTQETIGSKGKVSFNKLYPSYIQGSNIKFNNQEVIEEMKRLGVPSERAIA